MLDGDEVLALGVVIEPAGQEPPEELPELVAALVPGGRVFGLRMRLGTALEIAGTIAGEVDGDGVVAAGLESGVTLMTCPFWVHIRTEPEIWHSPEAWTALGCPGCAVGVAGDDPAAVVAAGWFGDSRAGAVKPGTGDVPEFVLERAGAGEVPVFVFARSGAGDVPAFVFARSGAGEVPALVLGTSGAVLAIDGMAGCDTSGGIGVEFRGWSADIGELAGDVVAAAVAGAVHALVPAFKGAIIFTGGVFTVASKASSEDSGTNGFVVQTALTRVTI